jgi:hypothetical protein
VCRFRKGLQAVALQQSLAWADILLVNEPQPQMQNVVRGVLLPAYAHGKLPFGILFADLDGDRC